jgi:hypothetical protein
MDTLYYSNFCKHSQGVIQFLVKANLAERMSFLCIDKRRKEGPQTVIVMENGKTAPMPPHVHSVPALVLGKGYTVVYGEDIVRHYQSRSSGAGGAVQHVKTVATEPMGVSLAYATQSFTSEPYTFYNLSSDELSAKGTGGRRQMYNFVSASHATPGSISTPAETYRPDKVSKDVTIESLSSQRNTDVYVSKV